ncbi:hypothetical protein GGQ80_001628 [Sphingomonas jinjuensis]|uniref:Uncharacterized protein n=1 Tax=Sphingomonas jinjuensis TaxID=535907 RepID=A0A840FAR3_9SPHN|nr:hypothetical protein [Sphingomonas jinjuensis]MBB4153722.1 hypothetical protein [Sphingomonas jinjuensis]
MRRLTRSIVIAAFAVATAADAGAPQPAAQGSTAPRCVKPARVAAPVARPDGRVFLRGQPNAARSYFIRFKGAPCAGLDRFSIVKVETTAAGYCEGDKVRAYRDATRIEAPACVIDGFDPVDGRGL